MESQPSRDGSASSEETSQPLTPTSILQMLTDLRASCTELESRNAILLDAVHPAARESARNVIHYLALRSDDLRTLQPALAQLGLSSLGRSESHVVANLDAVTRCLRGLAELPESSGHDDDASVSIQRGQAFLDDNSFRLLGPPPRGRSVRIMVTLPSEAANEPALVGRLLDAGMTLARINSAHDGPEEWCRMCAHVRAEAASRGVVCRILFDLAGPKIRTGPIEPGPEVLRIRPVRDLLGRVERPAELALVPEHGESGGLPPGVTQVPVPLPWLSGLREGEDLELDDARGRKRLFRVKALLPSGACIAHCTQTAYITTGTQLRAPDGRSALVGHLPATEQAILLRAGDHITVLRSSGMGRPAAIASETSVARPAVIGCTLPEAFDGVLPGHAIWFDDGKIGGTVVSVSHDSIDVRITDASPKGDSLRADKGINLPDSPMSISGLTPQDREALPIAAREVDIVGMSFVQSPADVRLLAHALAALGSRNVGIVLKIETRRAFDNLPALLLAAMESASAGVMIARGDLAVEVGYGRLAEVQEEILWMCEAAHIPVIWATQVLETLAKKGRPSRAEVTDAAMAVRAECVMLNKGPYIVEAVEFLDGVLRRMQEHQSKKSSMLRALSIAQRFGSAES